MAVTQAESKLISIFIQTLLYGAYAVLFIITYYVLVHRRPPGQPIRKVMLGISVTMFVIASMHIGVNFTRIIRAFVTFESEPGGPGAFFNHLSEFTQIFGSALYLIQTLVGDGVVLLRCYLVWNKRFLIIILPFLLWLGCAAASIGILYSFARIETEAQIFVFELSQWIISFFSMTLATNVICTSLVALRIWYVNRRSISFTNSNLRPIMLLVVESGAVYSVTLLVLLILYKTGSWFQYVLLDSISPIVGLVFSMIIIRIGLGITMPTGESFSSTITHHTAQTGSTLRPHPTGSNSSHDDLQMNKLRLKKSQLTLFGPLFRPSDNVGESNAASVDTDATRSVSSRV